jgi:hypothetical protein
VRRFPGTDRFEELPSGCYVSLLVTLAVWLPLLILGLIVALRVSMQ